MSAADKCPTLFRDMTDAEKGALLLAEHEGRAIEMHSHDEVWIHAKPNWTPYIAYRIAPPEPVVETVTITGYRTGRGWLFGYSPYRENTHRLTFPTIDGQPATGVYTGPDGHQITLEEV